jgi:hypothetical protein
VSTRKKKGGVGVGVEEERRSETNERHDRIWTRRRDDVDCGNVRIRESPKVQGWVAMKQETGNKDPTQSHRVEEQKGRTEQKL